MILNQATLSGIFVGFNTIFNKTFQGITPQYPKVATVVPSTTKEESYNWLGKIPKMREWIGERTVQNISTYNYTIKNKDFESTIEVDKNDIEDDNIGMYTMLVGSLADAAARHADELIFGLLADGFSKNCYDGKMFFSTNHKEGESGVQSNKGTAALSATSYGTARAAMMSLKDDAGNPLKVMPNLLVVPPQLESTAKEILMADEIDGTTNIHKGSAELCVVPDLSTNATAWYLLDTTKPIRPLIYQVRRKLKFVALTNENDSNVFNKKKYEYGVDYRGNVGYGLWQLAFGSTGASS